MIGSYTLLCSGPFCYSLLNFFFFFRNLYFICFRKQRKATWILLLTAPSDLLLHINLFI